MGALICIINCGLANAATVGYWRFEEGSAGASVSQPFGAVDSSGNGNHLTPWSVAGSSGFKYRADIALGTIPLSGVGNDFSIQNTGTTPAMSTCSATQSYSYGSNPTGIDIEAITPSQFTIEALFKPAKGSHRTIVGRDAMNVVTGTASLSALYFQIKPDDSVKVQYADVSGYTHVAQSAEYIITGYDSSSDPDGLTGNWYYMVATCDGKLLSLYLQNVSDNGPLELLVQTDISESGSPDTSLAKGTTNGSNWHAGSFSVGRGLFSGNFADRAIGFIDEVRISDVALSTEEFLIPYSPADETVAHNPLMYGADPDVLLVDNKVWLYPTSGEREKFYTFSSSDLIDWQKHGPILNIDNISWMPDGKWGWAPSIAHKNGKYYFYFCAGGKQAYAGVATSDSPSGPFIDSGQVLVTDNNEAGFTAIDPMVFTDPVSGKTYFYIGGGGDPKLRVFELNSDMISIKREISVDTPYMYNEGPYMHYHDGVYYLSYSHGHYQYERYSVHYATSSSPTGPWTYQGNLLHSDYRHKAPGHHSFLYNAAMDQWYLFYHRYDNRTGVGPYSGSRKIAIEEVHYNADGTIQPFALTNTGIGPVWLGNNLRSDYDSDGRVALKDLLYFAGAWLTDDNLADMVPVGGDGVVDFDDFVFFGEQVLKTPQVH